jgi:hypothetical protein
MKKSLVWVPASVSGIAGVVLFSSLKHIEGMELWVFGVIGCILIGSIALLLTGDRTKGFVELLIRFGLATEGKADAPVNKSELERVEPSTIHK